MANLRSKSLRLPKHVALIAVSVGLLAGCRKEEITSYRAPKDKEPPVVASKGARNPHGAGGDMRPRSQPQLTWKLPEGWSELGAGKMSLASFAIKADGGQAQVAVTPLPNMAGRENEIVNMWRAQFGQPALSAEDAAKQLQPTEVAGGQGKLFEVSGQAQGEKDTMRIVTAFLHRPDASWFFRLSGDDKIVASQKDKFVAFVKSVEIKEGPAEAAPAVAAEDSVPSGPKMNWSVPEQWKQIAAGQMQIAKFAVPEKDSARAEVSVSVFPSDSGGTLANVNRWRGQLGLGPIAAADLGKTVTPLDPADSQTMLVDMKNNGKQLIGAIVPRGGQWFFYKLLGDEAAVTPQKVAFIAFAKSKP